ncbi:LAMI_0E10946g1_1 [Lachancea mirantina]|uniref:LAMI_0E10946g1_1 n=1 Tax=Lachancea mirantina TaxID=1230905 RepID=A0A1G4JP83_9SACH|nr:LAMI_0E10946g1_1 [Lachancea mirantina]
MWNESEVLVDRKSKFQGRCCRITSQEDIPKILDNLLGTNKAVARASHQHMYAWRVAEVAYAKNVKAVNQVKEHYTNLQQGSSDCGEAGAGRRLLTLLENYKVVGVLLIVTRWYGGTPLGPKRFRNISTVATESLKRANVIL